MVLGCIMCAIGVQLLVPVRARLETVQAALNQLKLADSKPTTVQTGWVRSVPHTAQRGAGMGTTGDDTGEEWSVRADAPSDTPAEVEVVE